MPAGVDQQDFAGLQIGRRALQVLGLDQLPFAFRDRDDAAGAEEAIERNLVDACGHRHQMDRRVHMGRRMHDGREALGQRAVAGVIGALLEPHALVARPDRGAEAPGVTEIVEFKPGLRLANARHCLSLAARSCSWRVRFASSVI